MTIVLPWVLADREGLGLPKKRRKEQKNEAKDSFQRLFVDYVKVRISLNTSACRRAPLRKDTFIKRTDMNST